MPDMSPGDTFQMDPNDALVFTFDWSAFLEDRTISASVWIIAVVEGESGLADSDASILNGSTSTEVKLATPVARSIYKVTNRITLSGSPAQSKDEHFFVEGVDD